MKVPILGRQTLLTDYDSSVVAYAEAMNRRQAITDPARPLYTGRFFAILKPGVKNFKNSNKFFRSQAGLNVASVNDFPNKIARDEQISDADVLTYDHLGLALVGGSDAQVQSLSDSDSDFILVPEKVVYVPDDLPSISRTPEHSAVLSSFVPASTLQKATWGMIATNTINSAFTGKGQKICVLDTGFDSAHPDFSGRNITSASFVPGETTNDGHGHGTHCVGTACGATDRSGYRYGVASESDIYVGKVLSNSGSGAQQYILDGITWAADNEVDVISMSLGSAVYPGMGFDLVYERAARYANSKGTILVAAAGNESHRSMGIFNPVGSPADCPSILAVGAVDSMMNVADFSNRTINPNGQIDLVGPGVDVYSSWPVAKGTYKSISGTSMATPHVAGLLALYSEKFPSYNYQQIILEMLKFVKRIGSSSLDVGAGFVMSP